jgi:hypothetical protein
LAPALASYDGAAELDRFLDLLLPGITANPYRPRRTTRNRLRLHAPLVLSPTDFDRHRRHRHRRVGARVPSGQGVGI